MSRVVSSIQRWRASNQLGRHQRVNDTEDVTTVATTATATTRPIAATNLENVATATTTTTNEASIVATTTTLPTTTSTSSTTETTRDADDAQQSQSQEVAQQQQPSQQQLEWMEEREAMRRKNLACTFLLVMILARLWAQALYTGDFGLLIVCLFSTSWTIKWVRMRHDAEIAMEHQRLAMASNTAATEDDDGALDIRFMSFQSQLAYAIMESQRHMLMMENPNHTNHNQPEPQGVSEAEKASWHQYSYNHNKQDNDNCHYTIDDDLPSCSICLCEYEPNDALVSLPCKHVYHQDCINSWCESHHRCPLCNYNLMDSNKQDDNTTTTSTTTAVTTDERADSIV